MNVYHLMTVVNAPFDEHKLCAVEYGQYIVMARSQREALEQVADWTDIIAAAEVWAAPQQPGASVLVTPDTRMTETRTLADHEAWARNTTSYRLVKGHRNTVRLVADMRSNEYLAGRLAEREAHRAALAAGVRA